MMEAAIFHAQLAFWTKVVLVVATIGCAVKYLFF
jgi:hypothetical protein